MRVITLRIQIVAGLFGLFVWFNVVFVVYDVVFGGIGGDLMIDFVGF